MQFILKAFYELEGLGAASGLVYKPPYLYLISDYSSYLYRYDTQAGQLDKMALFADSRDYLPKPEKFDFEAILEHDNALMLVGSGSTPQRNRLVRYPLGEVAEASHPSENDLSANPEVSQLDIGALYQKFKDTAQLKDDELNIEGTIYHQGQWLFFQRGNGQQAQNGLFILHAETLDASQPVEFVPVQLPVINQVTSGFTDAVLVGQNIYFLATAENSNSTYEDGEVLGSYIGCMDLASKNIQDIQLISTRHKFEGLTLYQHGEHKLDFLLCEDNDTEQLSSTIYKLTLSPEQ